MSGRQSAVLFKTRTWHNPPHPPGCGSQGATSGKRRKVKVNFRKSYEEKRWTYPTCAWSHSPWERSNTRGTWLVIGQLGPQHGTRSPHVYLQKLAAALMHGRTHAICCSALTNACVRGRESARQSEGWREREGRLWPAACTPRNRHKSVMWLQSGTTILLLLILLLVLPVREGGDLSPLFKAGGSVEDALLKGL